MTVKSKVKVKAKIKVGPKAAAKTKSVKKIAKVAIKAKPPKTVSVKSAESKHKPVPVAAVQPQAVAEAPKAKLLATPKPAVVPVVKRPMNPLLEKRRPIKRVTRGAQFDFMKAPEMESAFEVGDTVEVFCDHDKNRERIRGWIKGIVVQVDHKMVAVQFRSNVYLTDGWMVPDRILWYPVNSEHIREVGSKKTVKDKRDFIPDY